MKLGDNLLNGRRYLQIMYPIMGWYLKYKKKSKNSYNSTTLLKIGRGAE